MGPELMTLLTWITGVLMFLLFLYVIGTWNYDTFRKRKMKYLAPKMPFVGNLWPIFSGAKSYPEMMLHLYSHGKKYGYCGMFQFTRPFILLCDSELIKKTMVTNFETFPARRVVPFEDLDPTIVKGVTVLMGERWKKARQNLSPVFTTSKLRTQFELLQECSKYSCEYLDEKMIQHETSSSYDRPVEIDGKDFFIKFSLNVIVSIAYGWSINNYKNADNELLWCAKHFVETGSGPGFLLIGGYLLCPELMHRLRIPLLSKKFHDTLFNATQRGMAQRMAEGTTRPDLVQHLITLKDHPEGCSFSDMDLAAQAVSFFFAGFETVSTTLYYVAYLLAAHPDHQLRVQQEVDEMLENTNGEPTYEDICKLKYLEMVLQETIRMYPSLLIIDRVCTKACSFPVAENEPPLIFKEGELVVIPIFALHRDPEYFPEPDKFDPERFSQDNIKNIKPNTYIPFGLPGRKCMGDRFAMLEMKLVMATILAQFNFCAVSSTPIPMVFKKKCFFSAPEDGYTLGVTSRKN